jgi:hypothetical protein
MSRIDLEQQIYQTLMMARTANILFDNLQEELEEVLKAYKDSMGFGRLPEYADAAGFAVARVQDMCRGVQDAFNEAYEAKT